MSRYSKRIDETELCWGFDTPLNEYFLQLYDKDDEIIFCIGTVAPLSEHPLYPGKNAWSKEDILNLYKSYIDYIPQEHIQAVEKGERF